MSEHDLDDLCGFTPETVTALVDENRQLRIEVGLLRREKKAVESKLAAVIAEHRAQAAARRRWWQR